MEHQFSDPSADYHALGALFGIIWINFLAHQIEVLYQAQALICLQIFEANRFEAETTGDEIGRGQVVLLLSEELEGIYFGNVCSLLGIGTVSHCCFNILLF